MTNSRYPVFRNRLAGVFFEKMCGDVLRAARRILTISSEGKQLCVQLVPDCADRVSVVPAAVDPTVFHPGDPLPGRSQLGVPPDAEVVIFVGRLERLKGLDLLLDAFPLVAAARPKAHLILVGEGGMRGHLEQRARELGVAAHVRFTGPVRHDEELPQILRAGNAFAFPSICGEGCPSAVLEALASGLPIVATPMGETAEIVRNGANGFLVRTRDTGEFAAALVSALRLHATLSDGAVHASLRYTARRIAQEVTECLQACVRGSR